ncbi:hypothetical protein [Kamptonema formosum]|uniref:hypothetical protein n=1 Tax=Kamptonema formosum TaxID=331992 RepID=UPI0003648D64|nr:hypothetical protein [Oscillatoria sp. PCC 10802]
MNDELQLRAKHFAALKSKYKSTQYEDSSPSSLLYLILRKADLEIELTDLELDWLKERQLFDTIDLIWLARRRAEEPQRLETEFSHLKSKYQFGKAVDLSFASRLYPLLWKLDSEGTITDAEIKWLQQQGFARTASLAQDMGRFAALKAKYKATNFQKSSPDSPLYQILKKLDAGKRLTDADANWLLNSELLETLEIFLQQEAAREADFAQLKSKYQVTRYSGTSASSQLYPLLQKFDSEAILNDAEIQWLQQQGLTEIIAIQREREAKRTFAELKAKYRATQDEDSSLSSPLYQIIQTLETSHRLQESEINWLNQQGLSETAAIAQQISHFTELKEKYQATQYQEFWPSSPLYRILQELASGKKLNDTDEIWLRGRVTLSQTAKLAKMVPVFAELKTKYRAIKHEDCSPDSPLFEILQKLELRTFMSEPDFYWLEQQGLTETLAIAQELKVKLHFAALKSKYRIVDPGDKLPLDPFYTILQKLERGERLDPLLVIQLIEEGLLSPNGQVAIAHYRLEALFCEREFKRTKSQYILPTASSYWRKANEPQRALELTNKVNLAQITDKAFKSRLLVTRGAALRDMAQLDEAATCAREAIKCQPDSHQPYTLMGAICYDIGEYEQGNELFEKAIERGAEREEMEDEIKRVLRNARDKTQQREAAQYLLNQDPVRYAWAQSYLN